jgi:carbon storage regulator
MLVLSRKVGESIVIDGHIQVTVVEIRGDKIRLGIEDPRDIAVWREELAARSAANERRELATV